MSVRDQLATEGVAWVLAALACGFALLTCALTALAVALDILRDLAR